MKLYQALDPQNPIEVLDLFYQVTQEVDEYDYGDCMREWNHDLLYLREHLQSTTPWALQKVAEMQLYVQYQPNWDVESTRARLLKDTLELREHILLGENSGRAA